MIGISCPRCEDHIYLRNCSIDHAWLGPEALDLTVINYLSGTNKIIRLISGGARALASTNSLPNDTSKSSGTRGNFAESNIQCRGKSIGDQSKPDKSPLNSGILTQSHPPDLCLVQVLVQVVKVLPPLEKHGVTNEFKPRSKGQAFILEHLLQLISGYVFVVLGLVRVDVEINFGLDE